MSWIRKFLVMAFAVISVASFAQNPITHVVFIVKENHSFDNLFGTFPFPNFAAANPFVPPSRENPAGEPAGKPPAKDEDGGKNGT